MVAGAPARDPATGRLHISALVLDRDGRFAVQYDKQHATPTERAAGFSSGTSGCTLTLDGWRLGLGICWDSGFPEHARAAALDGCHAYLVGAMFGQGTGVHQRAVVFPARALDNTSYTLLANHCAPGGPFHGCGGSAVWNPDGTLLTDAGPTAPAVAVARLNPHHLAAARTAEPVLLDPSLTTPPHPRLTTPSPDTHPTTTNGDVTRGGSGLPRLLGPRRPGYGSYADHPARAGVSRSIRPSTFWLMLSSRRERGQPHRPLRCHGGPPSSTADESPLRGPWPALTAC